MLACNLFVVFTCLSVFVMGSYYMVTDKPVVTYVDHEYISYINISSSRYGRRNHMYYTSLHMTATVPLDNNFTVEFVFYEAVNNQYRRSLIEMRFKLCNFVFKDPVFGAAIRKQITYDKCPFPAGSYHFTNMTASAEHLPPMPFTRGRIHLTMYLKTKTVFKGYGNLELKEARVKT